MADIFDEYVAIQRQRGEVPMPLRLLVQHLAHGILLAGSVSLFSWADSAAAELGKHKGGGCLNWQRSSAEQWCYYSHRSQ